MQAAAGLLSGRFIFEGSYAKDFFFVAIRFTTDENYAHYDGDVCYLLGCSIWRQCES